MTLCKTYNKPVTRIYTKKEKYISHVYIIDYQIK